MAVPASNLYMLYERTIGWIARSSFGDKVSSLKVASGEGRLKGLCPSPDGMTNILQVPA